MSQKRQILQFIEDYGSITPLDAMKEFGIMRLAARIWDLRRDGYDIVSETETRLNRYGESVRYSRYTLAA